MNGRVRRTRKIKSNHSSEALKTGVQESAADPQPTARDRENARIRRHIAASQNEEYAEAERLALAALGPDWHPWMKLVLLDSDYHTNGNTEPAATVYKV